MPVAGAIREAVPLARIKGSHESSCGDSCVVIVQALAMDGRFSILVREGRSAYRQATPREVGDAGFTYEGTVAVHVGDTLISAAMTAMR